LPIDDDFTPQLGRIRDRGQPGGQRLSKRLRKAAARLGPKGKTSRYSGRSLGRGSATARRLEFQRRRIAAFRMRRVMVKFHISRAGRITGNGAFRAHLHYIQRDGVERDGRGGELYGREGETPGASAFLERSEDDRHQFRIIVSPEDGVALGDLREHTRALMTQMERDLGTRLDWVAVDHHNTGHSHTHIVVRGKDARGKDLIIAPDYLKSGLRVRASELVTERLGPRRDLEIARARHSEVQRDRLTAIDRTMLRDIEKGELVIKGAASSEADRFDRSMRLQRLSHLEQLGLVTQMDDGRWQMKPDWDRTLADMGRRNDVIATLAHRFGKRDGVERLASFDPARPAGGKLVGTVLATFPDDELRDRRSIVVEDFDGRQWLVDLGEAQRGSTPPEGAVVEVGPRKAKARSSDRVIANIAEGTGGIYSERLHAEADPSSSATFRQAHVRRLEALRRGRLVERMQDGSWTIPDDYLEKALAFEADRAGGVSLNTLSWLTLEEQVTYQGVTWLDEEHGERGGARLHSARQARIAWLREQGLLAPNDKALNAEARNRLRQSEHAAIVARIAKQSGRQQVELQTGDTITGKYERAINLGSGRVAVIGNAKEFALVPWRPEIERHLGRELVAKRTAQGVSWTIGMSRQRGLSR
jgi:type IV secretory pathway VirD2 relaxase